MKKMISVLLACLLVLGMIGCSESGAGSSDQLSIVTTIFPLYDWTREILGDNGGNVELTMLLDSGVDLHSYQPTAQDMAKIATCDVLIYVGGESDAWMKDALAAVKNKDLVIINALDVLGDTVVEEEIVDGMEQEHEEELEEDPEADEHIWLSLRNAQTVSSYIAQQLCAVDAEHAAAYTENAASYCARLSQLDAQYQEVVDGAAYDTLLFADRFPFRYLALDYNLSYYAAFSGCSAETEASVETITFLAEKLTERNLPAVMIIDGSDGSIASTVIQTAGANPQILTLNSLQSVTAEDAANGADYLSIMQSNLEVLKDALN